MYRGADKSLARPERKQARKHVGDARDFNNIETRAVKFFFFFLQGKAPKEIHAILTETLACFLPGRAKGLAAPLYCCILLDIYWHKEIVLAEFQGNFPLAVYKRDSLTFPLTAWRHTLNSGTELSSP